MNIQKAAGISAIAEALIYIGAFVYFGAFSSYPSQGDASEKMAYLADNHLAYSAAYFIMYAVFGVLLAIIVVGLHNRLQSRHKALVMLASVFGVIWVALVVASGMLATIGLEHSVELAGNAPEKAYETWRIVSIFVESLGGGNELVGGLWVLLVSIAALKAGQLGRGGNYLGVLVGLAGIATTYPSDLFTQIFGLSQILWFLWLGWILLSSPKMVESAV